MNIAAVRGDSSLKHLDRFEAVRLQQSARSGASDSPRAVHVDILVLFALANVEHCVDIFFESRNIGSD